VVADEADKTLATDPARAADFLTRLSHVLRKELAAAGAAFASFAFDANGGRYLQAYTNRIAAGRPTAYHADESWETYDGVAAMLDEMWATWKSGAK